MTTRWDLDIKLRSYPAEAPSNEEEPPLAHFFSAQVAVSHEAVRRMRREVFERMAEKSARSMANELQGLMLEFFDEMNDGQEVPPLPGAVQKL